MNMRVKLIVIGAYSLVVMAMAATSANAASKQICQQYANTAVQQYHQMQQQFRGCTGFRWHAWYDGHYAWCRKVSLQSAQSEAINRQNTIVNGGAC